MLLSKPNDDLPGIEEFEIDYSDFLKYRDDWKLWRSLGHFTDSGAWVAPVSFQEAQALPMDMIQVFFTLDNLLERMQNNKKKQSQSKGKK